MKKLVLILLTLVVVANACKVPYIHTEYADEAYRDCLKHTKSYVDSVNAVIERESRKAYEAASHKIYRECGTKHTRDVYEEYGYVYEKNINRTNFNGYSTLKADGKMLYHWTFKKLNNKSVRLTTKEWFYSDNGYVTTNTTTEVLTFEEVIEKCQE